MAKKRRRKFKVGDKVRLKDGRLGEITQISKTMPWNILIKVIEHYWVCKDDITHETI